MKRVIRPDGTTDRIEFHDKPQTADETMAFAKYSDLSPLELMRRLRRYEWDAAEYKKRADQLAEQARAYPPMYEIEELAACRRRVKALLDVPRRRNIPKSEVADALYPDRYADYAKEAES